MSEERRKRKQEREREDQPRAALGLSATAMVGIVAIVAIVALVAGTLLWNQHKHTRSMDAFAQCLTAKGAKMYGAFWCPHCAEQKEMFSSSFKYAPYIECGIKGSQAIAQVCTDAGVKRFPTWVYPDGTRTEGKRSLEYLSDETSCPLP
jgi:hypothetical protein